VAFYEEPRSWMEQKIGRRFPLAVIILAAIVLTAYLNMSTIAISLTTAFGIIVVGYYRDINGEKDTIKLVGDEKVNASND
jgi:hypothetical protein